MNGTLQYFFLLYQDHKLYAFWCECHTFRFCVLYGSSTATRPLCCAGAVRCCALRYCAVACCALPCCSTLCRAVSCRTVPRHAVHNEASFVPRLHTRQSPAPEIKGRRTYVRALKTRSGVAHERPTRQLSQNPSRQNKSASQAW